ncbi:hypothetical protein [Ornithinibacter sp.]|uniref:hypothetical protein n=1 Tax=Ornithinibacter sp. TaxID=2862748 RepID=UPI002CA58B5E|nr:hypothetical protein [Ornithinibacter sp.]HQX87370.1 hypothetical protein [Ornithinibacter sp.]HQZ09808.1 hypothetical protein [Ornithinibacter sp.]HRA26021.1 hypothetical protein [Ornithinibacter sp.]
MSEQEPQAPAGSFAEHLAQSPSAALSGGQSNKVELFVQGGSIGWLGEDSGQWAVVTSQDAAVPLKAYVHTDGVLYYCNAGDDSRYLSVSDGYHYVGFYNWVGARGWTLNGGVLTSLYTNAPLSIYSTGNGYLYANSGYTPVTVQFH